MGMMIEMVAFRDKRLKVLKKKFNKLLYPAFKKLVMETEPDHWKHGPITSSPWDECPPYEQLYNIEHGRYLYCSNGTWDDWKYAINLITERLTITKGPYDAIWFEIYYYNRKTKLFEHSHTPKERYHL